MPVEIERKFLVTSDDFIAAASSSKRYKQGYMIGGAQASVRVRISGEDAKLNIKSATNGIRRQEYEYDIPMDEAEEILTTLCGKPLVEKTRYYVNVADHLWEVDVFEGDNAGLVVAEVELACEDQVFVKPRWLGEEVSADLRYYNTSLGKNPFKNW